MVKLGFLLVVGSAERTWWSRFRAMVGSVCGLVCVLGWCSGWGGVAIHRLSLWLTGWVWSSTVWTHGVPTKEQAMTMTKAQKAEQVEALDRLREWVKPGDELTTIIRSVARSGMSRTIDVYAFYVRDDGKIGRRWLSSNVATACGYRTTDDGALKVGGCGMDMGFAVVYNLASVLFGDGYALSQVWL